MQEILDMTKNIAPSYADDISGEIESFKCTQGCTLQMI